MGPHRGTNICVHLCKCCGADVKARWMCIQELMHVPILTKSWDQIRGDWDMHKGPQMGAHFHTTMEMGSQVVMHTCTEACTYSNQDLNPEKG